MSLTAAFLYEAATAVELSASIELLKRGENVSSKKKNGRLIYYHIFIILFVIICAIIAISLNGIDNSLGKDSNFEDGSKLYIYIYIIILLLINILFICTKKCLSF